MSSFQIAPVDMQSGYGIMLSLFAKGRLEPVEAGQMFQATHFCDCTKALLVCIRTLLLPLLT